MIAEHVKAYCLTGPWLPNWSIRVAPDPEDLYPVVNSGDPMSFEESRIQSVLEISRYRNDCDAR